METHNCSSTTCRFSSFYRQFCLNYNLTLQNIVQFWYSENNSNIPVFCDRRQHIFGCMSAKCGKGRSINFTIWVVRNSDCLLDYKLEWIRLDRSCDEMPTSLHCYYAFHLYLGIFFCEWVRQDRLFWALRRVTNRIMDMLHSRYNCKNKQGKEFKDNKWYIVIYTISPLLYTVLFLTRISLINNYTHIYKITYKSK